MLDRTNLEPQKNDAQSTALSSLGERVAQCVLSSKHVKRKSEQITKVREGVIPAERIDVLATETRECLRLSGPSTLGERILDALGAVSERQATLIARADTLNKSMLEAQLTNATHLLEAATLVESTYLNLFQFNTALLRSVDLLTTCVALATREQSEWAGAYRASKWLEAAAHAEFESFGMTRAGNGWIPEINYWAIKNAQNILLGRANDAVRQAIHRQQQAILASIPQMGHLNDAAIQSTDGQIVVSCNLGGEVIQRTARELAQQMELLHSQKSDRTTKISAMCESDKLSSRFETLAVCALEQIENTENQLRRYIQNTLFPDMKGLRLLDDLYSVSKDT